MTVLVTSNPAKFGAVKSVLESLRIEVIPPTESIPEIQSSDADVVLADKAKRAATIMGFPCLVDDACLYLDRFPSFPGPMTGTSLKMLGAEGFRSLICSEHTGATLSCGIAIFRDGTETIWRGSVHGFLDVDRPLLPHAPGPLSAWFIPDEGEYPTTLHRLRALQAFGESR
ncbi:non-canonical purine NTP pyrophosphatase [Azospirillum isscasi]|uniref:non-canonical purine NTP pyrophosphatase n=1 Tax=Azospirillum isscasi TaxID=3053926 RepID=UPI0038992DDE